MSDFITFIPLGGSDEIGMNLNVYGYRDKFIIIDAGLMFIDLPGAETAIPDTEFIDEFGDSILGIVLTHGHEDHIGAIAHIWPKVKCPIYATPFTASLVARKLQERGITNADIKRIPLSGEFDIGEFAIRFVTLTHSILEPNGVLIKTPAGTLFHTGDWKIDSSPLIGEQTDTEALKKFADAGVLAMICDSTNAMEPGHSGSEAEVKEALFDAIQEAQNRVFVACFASNVVRFSSVMWAAHAAGRSVALMGRSMQRMYDCARENGYLSDLPPIVNLDTAMDSPRDQIVILCTGSQGEPRAALTKLALEQHPSVWIDEDDTVILSSRVIPGNEKDIAFIHNTLIKRGVNVITHHDGLFHVSGHPCQDELKLMYEWVRPSITIPVHGEKRHQYEHAKLAKSWGVEKTIVPENGDIIRIYADGNVSKKDQVPCTAQAIDGTCLVPTNDPVYKHRARLADAGVVMVSIILKQNSRGYTFKIDEILCDYIGIVDGDGKIKNLIVEEITKFIGQSDRNYSFPEIKQDIEKTTRNLIFRKNGKKPVVICHIYDK